MKTRSKGTPSRASSCGRVSDVDDRAEARALDVRPRHLDAPLLALERDESPVGWQRAGEADRAVAAQRPDLEDGPCSTQPRQYLEQPSLERADLMRRQPVPLALAQHLLEDGVGADDQSLQVAIDIVEQAHASTSPPA